MRFGLVQYNNYTVEIENNNKFVFGSTRFTHMLWRYSMYTKPEGSLGNTCFKHKRYNVLVKRV